MKAEIRPNLLICTACNGVLHTGFGVLRCLNKNCEFYGKEYRYPKVQLEPVIQTDKENNEGIHRN